MKDLTKCLGTDCKKRESCLRFTIKSLPKYQSYLCMVASIKVVEECKFFIENQLTHHTT